MPGPFDPPSSAAATAPPAPDPSFSVYSAKVELDIDFLARSVHGVAEINVQPQSKDLPYVRLHCRQARIKKVTVEGREARWEHNDPHSHIYLSEKSTVHHHKVLRQKVEEDVGEPSDENLWVFIPPRVKIKELDASLLDALSTLGDLSAGGSAFAPLRVVIHYDVNHFREGLHFAGLEEGDTRYPHVYSRNSQFGGSASCLFPCVDDASARYPWEVSIRYPRTLGDVFRKASEPWANGVNGHSATNGALTNGLPNGVHDDEDVQMTDAEVDSSGLTEEDKALEMSVICSGDMTDDIVDPKDPSRKTVSFTCAHAVLPQHVALAVGPFEHVDLSDLRESDDDEMMGQAAIRVHGFCLPGRSDEVRNTCMALAKATDHFSKTYISYPFTSYKIVFVDDLVPEIAHAASLTLCSNSILYPEDVLDPLFPITRKLVHALAFQWMGINVIPKTSQDWWVIYALSRFMSDDFLEQLCGRNEHRFRMKQMADRVVELDVNRPSLQVLGDYLAVDPSEIEFMELKAPLVMFILNQKIKRMAKMGVTKIIYKVLLQAKTGKLQNGAISTEDFIQIVDKYLESKPIPDFWRQWVYGSGCPHFYVTQRFNKKKSVIEFAIRQTQSDRSELEQKAQDLDPSTFLKEVNEQRSGMSKKKPTRVFTGAMTVTVHEADGTPYDHIIPIHDVTTRFDAPYNTKYTRLKRNRRQKERAAAAQGIDLNGDGELPDEIPLYCLGDVLDSEKEIQEWDFDEWTKEDEEQMANEQFEWIRVDADFEWLCKITFSQPLWMLVAQLQQDPDVVAQAEALQSLSQQRPSKLISTHLTRTVMDRRYFHGIRTMATEALAKCAIPKIDDIDLNWIGLYHLEKTFQELFCLPGSHMVRSNDFSDRSQYLVQCAIPRAIAKVREPTGKGFMRAKRWILDKLKFNDNSHNEFSDCHYVATLLSALAEQLSYKDTSNISFDFDIDDDEQDDIDFQKEALNEIERHRRLDEWIPSYQNIITVTALQCQSLLMENGVIPRKMLDFLQYAKPGAAESVRLKAMECLVDLNMIKHPAILRYLIFTLAHDSSPYIREQLYYLIGRGLARIAIGDKKEESNQVFGGLVIEQDTSTESRAAMIERTQTLEGATKALKVELGNNEVLKEQLLKALMSPIPSLKEWVRLLDICGLVYEPKNSLEITIKYPFYWKVRHQGKAVLHFYRSTNRRTKSLSKIKEEQAPLLQQKSAEKRRRPSVADEPNKRQQFAPPASTKSNGAIPLKINLKKGLSGGPSSAASVKPPTSGAIVVKPPAPGPSFKPPSAAPVQRPASPFVKPPSQPPKVPTPSHSRAPTPSSVVSDRTDKPAKHDRPEKQKKSRRKIVRLKVSPDRLRQITTKPRVPGAIPPGFKTPGSNAPLRISQPQQRDRPPAHPKPKPRPESNSGKPRPEHPKPAQKLTVPMPAQPAAPKPTPHSAPPSASPPTGTPEGERKPLKLKLKFGGLKKKEGE
ncbi:Transcription initiation factor TFIID subunit 2 [Neofusicoccum ribis]|uniref:Transcription initiation factor TFIID subunit 2 n=1 Tax=Neofusicoccum ribis TaxID=45134 RepID=A0ABR3TC89_9PEZI